MPPEPGRILCVHQQNKKIGKDDDNDEDLEEGEIRDDFSRRGSAPSFSSLSDFDSDPNYDSNSYHIESRHICRANQNNTNQLRQNGATWTSANNMSTRAKIKAVDYHTRP